MPMNNRLLRPLASEFNPASISGMLCNLDASALSSLKQNSDGTTDATATDDPIGYWADLSGFGNHAVQSVATGSRPLLKLNNQNERPGLLFDGSNDFLAASVAGFKSLSAATIVQVVKPTAAAAANQNSAVFWGFGDGNTGGFSLLSSTASLNGETITFLIDEFTGRIGSSTYARAASTAQVIATSVATSGTSVSVNGSPISFDLASGITTATDSSPSSTAYTADNNINLGALLFNGSFVYTPELTLHQVIIYNKVLSEAELTRLSSAMQRKWGIV